MVHEHHQSPFDVRGGRSSSSAVVPSSNVFQYHHQKHPLQACFFAPLSDVRAGEIVCEYHRVVIAMKGENFNYIKSNLSKIGYYVRRIKACATKYLYSITKRKKCFLPIQLQCHCVWHTPYLQYACYTRHIEWRAKTKESYRQRYLYPI